MSIRIYLLPSLPSSLWDASWHTEELAELKSEKILGGVLPFVYLLIQ